MNVATDPWIPVLTLTGEFREAGLEEVCAAAPDIAALGCADPLIEAGIVRLLFAVDRAAAAEGTNALRWVRKHRKRFELFSHNSPFAQNMAMAPWWDRSHAKPAAVASYSAAGNGPVLLDHHHSESGIRLTPAELARLLLVRQAFSAGGRQPYSAKPFGSAATYGRTAVAAKRPLCFYHCATLADTIAANRIPGPLGQFLFTWPDHLTPGSEVTPRGQLDTLTWLSRSILAVPDSDGLVPDIALCEGMRYGETTRPESLPHTTYISDGDPPRPRPRPVHFARPGWRQLLTSWADPHPAGVLAHPAPRNARIRLIGLSMMQARIDGPVTGSMPVPTIDRGAVANLTASVTAAYRHARSHLARSAHGGHETKILRDRWVEHRWPMVTPELTARAEHVVAEALVGHLTLPEAAEAMRAAAEDALAWVTDDLVATRRYAAAAQIPTTSRRLPGSP